MDCFANWKWIRAESNCCPNWVLTFRSFTGLAFLILKAGSVHCPERRMLRFVLANKSTREGLLERPLGVAFSP